MKNSSTNQTNPELTTLVVGWTANEVAALDRFWPKYERFRRRMTNWIERGGRAPVAPEITPTHRRSEILMMMMRNCPHN